MSQPLSAKDLLYLTATVQLGLLSLDDVQQAAYELTSGTSGIGPGLVEKGKLTSEQHRLVAAVVETYLAPTRESVESAIRFLECTPAGAAVVQRLAAPRGEATVSFDGSKTAPRATSGAAASPAAYTTGSGDRFQIIRMHACGGLGEVSVARDEQVRRDVALKQLKDCYADDPTKRQRFVLEGEVTGALEHPGIVPVYAMGADALGRPFYAMRFVRGESLRSAAKHWFESEAAATRYRRDSLEFRRLLGRFVSVCHAIEYAHSRGVVHRDLKPANVMLGRYGETYVVDWGMARVLGEPVEDPSHDGEQRLQLGHFSASSETQMGSILGTPAFMSPEQASGSPGNVGPASDIYSLGATLYYILVGTPPFPGTDENPHSYLRKIIEGQYKPPREICPSVPRELEGICLCAMAVRPADRYPGALALAADVERWLADEPVDACAPSAVERFGRWARKHKNWLVAGAAALLLVSIVSTAAAWLIEQARERERLTAHANLQLAESESKARQAAERRFLLARETVDEWLTGYSEALRHHPGMQPVRMRMLELAAQQYEDFIEENTSDPTLQLEHGRTLVRLGSIHRALGRHDDAIAALQQAKGRLQSIPKSSFAGEAEVALALAGGTLGLVHADLGDADRADAEFVASIDRLEKIDSDSRQLQLERLAALVGLCTNRGGVHAARGDFEHAESAFQMALKYGDALVQMAPDELRHRASVAAASIGMGQIKLATGNAAAAAADFQKAVGFFEAASQINSQDAAYLQLAATANVHLATASRQLGDLEGEERAYRKSIEISTILTSAQPELPTYQEELAFSLNDLGQLLLEKFEPAEAIDPLTRAANQLETLSTSFTQIARYREALAAALDNLAQAELALGQTDSAISHSAAAKSHLVGLLAEWPDEPLYKQRLAGIEATTAQALFAAGNRTEAAAGFEQACRIVADSLDSAGTEAFEHFLVASIHGRYGELLWRDDQDKALEMFATADEHMKRVLEASGDPQYLAASAWSLLTCPAEKLRDAPRALEIAQRVCSAAPENPRYRLTLALAQAMSGNGDACRKTVDAVDLDKLALAPAFGYVSAIAATGDPPQDGGLASWRSAHDWTVASLPGHWDLRVLAELTANRLQLKDHPYSIFKAP